MPAYTAPIDEIRYLLSTLLPVQEGLAGLPDLPDAALLGDILAEAGRFAAEQVAPLNLPGDAEGCSIAQRQVRTPAGYREAYAAFVAGGWPGLSQAPEWGGQGLPRAAQVLLDEMLASASLAFGLFPGLTRGAVEAIEQHGDATLKALWLPPMVAGRWMGAMALTEAHAGTDLGLLRCKAEPDGAGAWRITGSKIFISAGEHDLAENIVHLVLARLPDAPPGTAGISLFLVPKILATPEGGLGAPNAVHAASLEHKMGLHGSPTCVMQYEGATGWLLGAPHRGLAAMFTMMNAERLFVGTQGLGVAEAAYQCALAYARDRVQGRAPGQRSGQGEKGPQSILVHPDVQRMLLTIRGFTEAGRALGVWVAYQMDIAAHHPAPEARAEAAGMVALLTPVIKAAYTDLGFEAAVLGQQVFGGHGYVREWGAEQFVRDARITQIYEGTNGVQAMDLVGRKIGMEEGAVAARFFALVRENIAAAAGMVEGPVSAQAASLLVALARLEMATRQIREATDPAAPGAVAVEYLRLFGLVALGWMWLRMALDAAQAGQGASALQQGKLVLAGFYMARLLPQSAGLAASIADGNASLGPAATLLAQMEN